MCGGQISFVELIFFYLYVGGEDGIQVSTLGLQSPLSPQPSH